MTLYENVVIGNFLYGLGCAVGGRAKSDRVLSAVNLIQQTPADKLLGDVLLEFARTLRIIEFKSHSNTSKKEEVKHKQITAAIGKDENAIKISKAIHWFIETKPQDQSFIARIVPYLEAYPRDNTHHSLERFIEMTAEEAIRKEEIYAREDLRDYLYLVTKCQGSGGIGSGALILAVTGTGNLQFAGLTSMTQLRLHVPAYIRELEREMERALVQERQQERERDIDRTRGQERQQEREREMERALVQERQQERERDERDIDRSMGGYEL